MEALRFNGTGSEYFKIWIVNILLTIITLGIYYPWAKVRNRRYFYANSSLGGRAFEYHATGKQLFVGFLIGILFFALYTLLGQVNPRIAGVVLIIFMLALPWLIWRSLMFNMRVTSFSNVHFSFKGKLGKVYIIFLLYPLLFITIIALFGVIASIIIPIIKDINPAILAMVGSIVGFSGIFVYLFFFAFIKKSSTEYVINNSYYGQGTFQSELESKRFFIIFLKTIGISFIPMILLAMSANFFTKMNPEMLSYTGGTNGFVGGAELFFIVAYFVLLFVVMLIMSYMITRERSYIYDNIVLDDTITFESTLRARDLAWVMASNIFLIFLTLGLAFPWAKVRVTRLMLENTLVDTEFGFDNYITQQERAVSALGDQIGDAFDVDVGVAF
jgi:uncharacterized membrane protein YjgN (DUF898 family)